MKKILIYLLFIIIAAPVLTVILYLLLTSLMPKYPDACVFITCILGATTLLFGIERLSVYLKADELPTNEETDEELEQRADRDIDFLKSNYLI